MRSDNECRSTYKGTEELHKNTNGMFKSHTMANSARVPTKDTEQLHENANRTFDNHSDDFDTCPRVTQAVTSLPQEIFPRDTTIKARPHKQKSL